MAEKGTPQAKETYEKMSAATTEAADLIKKSYSTAVKGLQDYNNQQRRLRLYPEVARREVAFGVRRTFDRTCTQAARDADRADQATCGARPEVTLATAEPLKTGVAKALNRDA
jgi:hypothetical protein